MNSRLEHKRKKKRRGLRIVLFLLLMITGLVGYAAVQFYQGTQLASGESNTPKEENYTFNGVKDKNGRINVLLLGVDSRGEEQSRSDTMMMAQVDPRTDETKFVSLMGDM